MLLRNTTPEKECESFGVTDSVECGKDSFAKLVVTDKAQNVTWYEVQSKN